MTENYPQYIIDKAVQLRVEKQHTVPEIAEMLSIPSSIIFEWLKPYPLAPHIEQMQEKYKQSAQLNRKRAAKKRQDAYDEAWQQAPKLLKDISLFAFVCMYIGEGTKKRRGEVSIANSDAEVMKLSYKWMIKLKHPERSMDFGVQIHEDHNEEEIKSYWGKQIGINPDLIRITRKSNSGKLKGRKFRSPYGVFTIRASDTYFRSRLQALMDYTKKIW